MTTAAAPIPAAVPAPASSGTTANLISGQKSLNESYSTFLTLLTTQLKNQDPTSPLDPNQFTQQLVQMTGVQQQLLSNQLLQQIADNGQNTGVGAAVGLIGKTVTADTATAGLSGKQASWTYTPAAALASAQLSVADSTGRVVWTGAAPGLSAGAHTFTWNGRDALGNQLPDGGQYTLSVAATDASGAATSVPVSVSGLVTGVEQDGAVTNVLVGSAKAPIAKISKVAGS